LIVRGLAPYGAVLLYDNWTRVEVRRARVLRRAPKDRLRDPAYLEHELLPRLGLADLIPVAFPERMQPLLGTGLQPFQWPNQFAPYLVALTRYPISSYLEIGVLYGGTFIVTTEYLSRFAMMRLAIAVDLYTPSALWRYRLLRPQARFVKTESGTPEFARRVREWRPDLVLIDGDHTYPGVARDFACIDGISPLIAIHDIADPFWPGVGQFWREQRETRSDDYHFAEYVAQYPEVNELHGVEHQLGIGLMVRKDFGPPPA
jgi:Methyltransferase domain